jgi:hypothetical protein
MSSSHVRDDNDHHVKSNQLDSAYFLTHVDEQTDGYREYLSHEDEPQDNSRNPRNFFHEVNDIDTKWLHIARMHLNRNR